MFVINPVSHPEYHLLDPYVAQQRAEFNARAEARVHRHRQELLRKQLILNALRAQEYDQYPQSQFPSYVPDYGYLEPYPPKRHAAFDYEAAIQQARRQAVLEQAVRQREARLQEASHLAALQAYRKEPEPRTRRLAVDYEDPLQRARRQAIEKQATRQREARLQEARRLAALQAHRNEQELLAHRRADTERFLSAFLRRTQNAPANAEIPAQPIASTSKAPVQDDPSLKDRLEDRLMAEYESDVRDAFQSLLSSLSKGTSTEVPVARVPVVAEPSQAKVNEEVTPAQDKGKGKAKEIPDSDTEEEPSASPAQVAASLSQITSIASRLETLLATFQFPAELDFSPSRSPSPVYSALDTTDVFALTYAPSNAPLRAQEHALSSLLGDLDNVPSYGSHAVRDARRAVVARVEQALEELEKGVEERRGRARARKEDPVSVPPGNVTPEDLPHLEGPVVEEDFIPAGVSVQVEALAPAASSPIEAIVDHAGPSETSIEAPATSIPISIEIPTTSVAEPSITSLPTTSEVSETSTAQVSVPQEDLSKESEEPLVYEVSTFTESTASEDVIHVELGPSSYATRPTPPTIDTPDSLSKNTIGVSLSVSSSVIPDSLTLTHADADSPAEVTNSTNMPASYPPAASSLLTSEQTPSQVNMPDSDSDSYSTMESPASSSPVSDAEVDTFLLPASRPASPRLVPRHSASEDEGEVVVDYENEEDGEWSDVAA
ncbi:uncharacterized protein EDB91DRAFT_1097089 [Suillus paluster]|uniref:uncharacterized protein n=1 Tax=Suillus paluster TaxID=48578 RepID=UPI001B8685B0|nr:uncharacterized protein EDB91DRAFT_1097089 [Suillus paluster]KAG1755062.1 hypothetical protein EDB91DRAFT_1097089 [Suillus paluster]